MARDRPSRYGKTWGPFCRARAPDLACSGSGDPELQSLDTSDILAILLILAILIQTVWRGEPARMREASRPGGLSYGDKTAPTRVLIFKFI